MQDNVPSQDGPEKPPTPPELRAGTILTHKGKAPTELAASRDCQYGMLWSGHLPAGTRASVAHVICAALVLEELYCLLGHPP